MFALFIESLGLVLEEMGPVKHKHNLSGSPATATKAGEATLRRDQQCQFFFPPSSTATAAGDIVPQQLSSASSFHAWTESGWGGVGWGGVAWQPAADLEQSAPVGRAPPSPDQLFLEKS